MTSSQDNVRLPVGKLPAHLLAGLLDQVRHDPRVLLGPKVGADAAVLDWGDRVLIATADPVTFATDLIGWYAVQVNANDVACLGGTPRWFLATLLLPEASTAAQAQEVFQQLLSACEDMGVALIGGHTEVTYGLDRPIVTGTMLGDAPRDRVVWPAGAQPGDVLLLTKGIALEGTALLAREAADLLGRRGVSSETLERARQLLFTPGISVVRDALAACDVGGVHAMHDPTEGGLATGLLEMAESAGVGLEVDAAAVPLLPECREVCEALGLDPLGLLASGSLLLAASDRTAEKVQQALVSQGIGASAIGRVTDASEGMRLRVEGEIRDMPRFPRDELARFLSEGGPAGEADPRSGG